MNGSIGSRFPEFGGVHGASILVPCHPPPWPCIGLTCDNERMNASDVAERLQQLRYRQMTSPEAGRLLYEFVVNGDVENVLELGFGHGTSTCFIAAALQEKGRGSVTTIDRRSALSRRPNLLTLLDHLGLQDYVEPLVSERSYTWELMKLIERQTDGNRTDPCFDFCFLDGSHTWETDGLAFFLVDKLLRSDRWILFDDVHWTFATSPTLKHTKKVQAMPEDERTTPQVLRILGLLVLQHPAYSQVRLMGNYGWAYKSPAAGEEARQKDAVDRLREIEPALTSRRR